MDAVPEIRPAAKDIIFRLILEGNRTKRGVVVSVVGLVGALPLLLAAIEGNFVNPSLKLDGFHDVGYINQFLILLPFCALFFPVYFNVLEPSLQTVRQWKVVTMSEVDWSSFVSKANKVFSHWTIAVLPSVVAVVVTGFGLRSFTLAGLNNWNSPVNGHPLTLAAITGALPIVLLYYLLSGFVLRVAAIYFVLRKFLSYKVDIQPFHPDRCGGLSPLGRLSLRVMPAGIVAGICSLIGIASVYVQYKRPLFGPENVAIIAGYAMGLSVVFFVPSLAARSRMLASKKDTLQLISNRFNVVLETAKTSLASGEADTGASVKAIKELTKLHQLANDMPVFPFNSANLVRFFSSVLWPLLLLWIEHRDLEQVLLRLLRAG